MSPHFRPLVLHAFLCFPLLKHNNLTRRLKKKKKKVNVLVLSNSQKVLDQLKIGNLVNQTI